MSGGCGHAFRLKALGCFFEVILDIDEENGLPSEMVTRFRLLGGIGIDLLVKSENLAQAIPFVKWLIKEKRVT